MNRTEMLKRLEAGEDPLDLSIEKWEDIYYRGTYDEGTFNCALCEIFFSNCCAECVIYQYTDEHACLGTPYEKWYKHQCNTKNHNHTVVCPECGEIALEQIAFLKSLRKEDKT